MSLVDEARKLLGARWQHQARTPQAVDCLGLLVLAERGTGRDVADRTNYGRVPTTGELREGLQAHYGAAVLGAAPDLLQPGDKLLIRLPGSPEANHVAIVAQGAHGLNIIHAWSGGLCQVTEHGLSDAWRRRIVEVYR